MKSRSNNLGLSRVLQVGLAALAAGTVAVAMAGCSSGGSSSSGMSGKTVKMYTWIGGKPDRQQWDTYVAAGKAADPKVAVSYSGPPIGDYYTKLPTVLKGSSAPCLLTFQNGEVAPYVDGLEPLESYAKAAGVDLSSYNSAMIEQLSSGGKVYALPFNAEPNVIYYNKKLFKEAGVAEPTLGWTTDDFLAAAKATTKNGVYGFALGQGITPLATLLAAEGKTYVTKSGKAQLDNPDLHDAFQFMVDLANKYKVAKPLEASGGTFPDIDAFSTGQAAMDMEGLWDLQHEEQAIGKDNLGIAVIPTKSGDSKGFISGSGFGMTKTCGDKKAAFAAIAAMTSQKAQQSAAASAIHSLPARGDSLTAWTQAVGEPQIAAVVKQMTANGTPTPVPANLNQLNTMLTQYEVDAFSGKSTVKQVLDQVAAGLSQ
jgi:multiple sugar transport system substrate-binding protein